MQGPHTITAKEAPRSQPEHGAPVKAKSRTWATRQGNNDFIENIDDVCIHYDGGRVTANENLIAEISKRGLQDTTKQTGLDRKTIRGIVNGKKVKTSTLVKVVLGLRDARENKPTTLQQENKKKGQSKARAGKGNKANSHNGRGELKSLRRKRPGTA